MAPSLSRWRHALLGCWLLGIAAGPVAAQDLARVELSGGYALSDDGDFWPLGWFAGAAWPVTASLALSGEVTNNRRYETFSRAQADASAWSALFGVRVSKRLSPALTAIVRGASGVTHVTSHVYGTSSLVSPEFDVTIAITAPAMQLGGGVDVDLGTRVALRTLAEYRRIFDRRLQTLDLRAQDSLEVQTGFAIRLGSR